MAWIGLQIIGGNAYLFNQGELGKRSVRPSGTSFNWTAVKLLRALHVLSDRRIDKTILRVTMPAKDKERTKQRNICILDVYIRPLLSMAYSECCEEYHEFLDPHKYKQPTERPVVLSSHFKRLSKVLS